MTSTDPLDLAASLTEALNLDGEAIDPAEELALPDWTPDLVLGDDGLAEVEGALGVERVRPRWRVDTDERADYALRRASMYEEDLARAESFARTQKDQIDRWLEQVTKPMRDGRDYFTGAAADYARRLREADPKFRTLPLPCGGKLTAHDGRGGVDVEDEEAFTAWALEQGHDDVVGVTYKAKLAEIAKRYEVEGERFVAVTGDDPATDREVVPGVRPRPKGWSAKAVPPVSSMLV
jgi:hypothetical protein